MDQFRLEALRLAIEPGVSSRDICQKAEMFYQFLRGPQVVNPQAPSIDSEYQKLRGDLVRKVLAED